MPSLWLQLLPPERLRVSVRELLLSLDRNRNQRRPQTGGTFQEMIYFTCEVCGLFCVKRNGLYKCKRGHLRKTARKQEEVNETPQEPVRVGWDNPRIRRNWRYLLSDLRLVSRKGR